MDAESEGGDEGPCKHVDGLRLPLKPGSKSGFVGVQRSASKARPWQATLKVAGRKRLNVGSFKAAEVRMLRWPERVPRLSVVISSTVRGSKLRVIQVRLPGPLMCA